MNDKKIILDLCGGTGSWSAPYKKAGYIVHIITLPEYNLSDWWITDNMLRFRKQVWRKDGGEYLELPISSIYGILAAPPLHDVQPGKNKCQTSKRLNRWHVNGKKLLGYYPCDSRAWKFPLFLGVGKSKRSFEEVYG